MKRTSEGFSSFELRDELILVAALLPMNFSLLFAPMSLRDEEFSALHDAAEGVRFREQPN